MKKILITTLSLIMCMGVADAATARGGRGGGTTGAAPAGKTGGTTSARAARMGGTAAPAAPKTSGSAPAAKPSSGGGTVAARAGAMQKVVSTGTKVAAATENTVVSADCKQKYDGCMDSFCMLDNETGGRCLCSDKNAEYDAILAEIEKLDQQSYAMATTGVERIQMGEDAAEAIAAANAVAQSLKMPEEKKEEKAEKRPALDLSMWDSGFDDDEDEDSIFDESVELKIDPMEGKTGNDLHLFASNLCATQMPECKAEISMLRMVYNRRVQSDCAAYENTLKKQKDASAKKLATAEKALRDAALTSLREANKYDLGQCTIEFKKCMMADDLCGSDFSKCASVVATQNTSTRTVSNRNKNRNYQIKGASTTIEISAQTYDAVVAKKVMCESVTKQCVKVADRVWNTFLAEVAPQLKSAELIAEDNLRQNCAGEVAKCFENACKLEMKGNSEEDQNGYDLCITRPENMLNACKVPMEACGISMSDPDESPLWDYVMARLSAMRVDGCSKAVRECIQKEDNCGPDYLNCMGLDTDTIIRMCPYDSLVSCQRQYGNDKIKGAEVYDNIANMIQGLFLNIENTMYTNCKKAADTAMIEVCGSTENCNKMILDKKLGQNSLKLNLESDGKTYADMSMIPDADFGRASNAYDTTNRIGDIKLSLSGMIPWEEVIVNYNLGNEDAPTSIYDIGGLEAKLKVNNKDIEGAPAIRAEIQNLEKAVQTVINSIESDEKVLQCMTGRKVQGMKTAGTNGETATETAALTGEGRFKNLTRQIRSTIATTARQAAMNNYNAKYDEMSKKMTEEYGKIAKKIGEIKELNMADIDRENARMACLARASDTGTIVKDAADRQTLSATRMLTNNGYSRVKYTATFNPADSSCKVIRTTQLCADVSSSRNRRWSWGSTSMSTSYTCTKWGDPQDVDVTDGEPAAQ